MNEEYLAEIASQLSHPKGDAGIQTANQMHLHNIGMTRNAIKALTLKQNDIILELGHGNGHHIDEILNTDKSILYIGLEISELMSNEAAKFNANSRASFKLYDGVNIPFNADYFSKIMTINTLYFWKNPILFLNEIHRVLKPGGLFSCAFAEKDFMEKLPFTKFIFKLYNRKQVTELFQASQFKNFEVKEYTEQLFDKDGQAIERTYTVAVLEKNKSQKSSL